MASPADPVSQGGVTAEPPVPAKPPRAKRRRRALIEAGAAVLVALLLAAGLRAFVFQTFYIPSSSMVPTLGVYDRILVQKAFFNWHDVRAGDIVVFTHPPLDHCPGPQQGDLVKRVIALPGQTIYSSGNDIYVNGRLQPETYLPHYDPLGPPIPHASQQHPFRVPPGEFYMMGDNRAISCDSRYWGPIKGTSIVGKVIVLWWHNGHPDFHPF
ncbi:MAG TPA: signal peptidase I [Streptosporangiaceae bacterium]|jgi:signal peptidase I|nr:signal peptidase I [Streptosporangiaceae bacterium]